MNPLGMNPRGMNPGGQNGAHAGEHTGSHAGAHHVGSGLRTVSGLTLVSRVLGLARDVMTARMFGDTPLTSAFAAAFAIPQLFRRLFGEGAIAAAFIPAYAPLARDDRRVADALASLTLAAVALITAGLTLLLELALLLALNLGPTGLAADGSTDPTDPTRRLSIHLIMVALPFMPLVCVAAILGAMLQSSGRFGPSAAAPILLNLILIAAAAPFFILDGADPALWALVLCAAMVLSGAAQVIWSALALRGHAAWTPRFALAGPAARSMLRRFLPALLGLSTLQLNGFIDTLVAMWPIWFGPTIGPFDYPLDPAANGILYYGQRLYQFPLGVFGIAVATVVFPELSRRATDPAAFVSTLRQGLRLSLFIGLPASAGLLLVGPDLCRVVFGGLGHGFTPTGLGRVAAVLLGYAPAIWIYSLNQVFVRGFYAQGDTRTPLVVSACAVLLNLALNLTLIWPLAEAGLAWSTAISAAAQGLALALLLRARLQGQPLIDRPVRSSAARTLIATLAMAALVALVARALPINPEAWSSLALRLLTGVITGGLAYIALARLLRMDEWRWLLARRPAPAPSDHT